MLIKDRIAAYHAELSPQLRVAASYVAEHPTEVATRSLRSVAADLDVPPVTLSRLAKALGFEHYDQLKALCLKNLQQNARSLASRAIHLQQHHDQEMGYSLLFKHGTAIQDNIHALVQTMDMDKLNQVAYLLSQATRVSLLGALSSSGIVSFWGYVAGLAFSHWQVINESNGKLASAIHHAKDGHCFVLVTKHPYSHWSVQAAQTIREAGGILILLTDKVDCPALSHADYSFIIADESPQFFSSYVAMLAFIETLTGMVVSQTGEATSQHIAQIESNNYRLGIYTEE